MNMIKALQHLSKAITSEDNTKRNITKLLLDIHKGVTGQDCENKNNRAVIIDSMATNWSGGGGGGGGSSIVNPINVTIVNNTGNTPSFIAFASDSSMSETYQGGFYIDANGIAIINTSSNWMPTLSSGTNTLPTAYCLDNCMICIVDFMGEGYTYTLNGDATKTEVMGMDTIVITGDCTITVS